MEKVNLWPIIMSTIITFGLSSLWYGPFAFGKAWAKLSNKFNDSTNKKKSILSSYLVHIVLSFISYIILYFAIVALNINSSLESIFIGLAIWIAFIMPLNVSYFLWHKSSFKLLLIDSSINLINIIVACLIFANW